MRDLRERNALVGRRQQTNPLDGLFSVPVGREVSRHQIVALLALQHLADSLAADGCFDSVLHVSHVELETSGLGPIDREIQIRLADHAEQTEILDSLNPPHDADDLVAFLFECLEVIAEDLDRKLAFDPADCLFHVVGDGLREVPKHAGDFLELAIHGGDQLFLVFTKHRTPLFLRLEVDEVFGIEEAGGVGAVIGAADLARPPS